MPVASESSASVAPRRWLRPAVAVLALALLAVVAAASTEGYGLLVRWNEKQDKRAVVAERDWQRDKARLMRARG